MWFLFRLYVRNFWSHESRLPPDTVERMLVVLKSLYSSRIEEQFLSLATGLLLEMTSHSPDYTRNMFEFPLSECKFQVTTFIYYSMAKIISTYCLFSLALWIISSIWLIQMKVIFVDYNFTAFCSTHLFQDYTIDSNWRLRSTVLTPMFMETQATQGSGTQGPEAAGSQAATMRGQIRATQTSLEFSQTLAPGAGTTWNIKWALVFSIM